MALKNFSHEDGSTELLFIVFFLFPTTIMIIHLYVLSQNFVQLKTHLRQTICLKEQLMEVKSLVYKINSINKVIKTGENFTRISWLFPSTYLAKLSFKKLIVLLKKTQNLIFIKYLSSIQKNKIKGCHIPTNFYLSPYRHYGTKLLRDQDDLVKLNASSVIFSWPTPLYQYQFKINYKNNINPKIELISL